MTYSSRKPAPWASDENTSNLLDSILDDTRDAALAETRALAVAVEERRQAEVEETRCKLEAQRADTAARMEMESARQAQIQVRRTAALRAITADDKPAAHAPIEATLAPHPRVEEPSQLPLLAVEPLLIAPAAPLALLPQRRTLSNAALVAMAAAGIVLVGAVTLLSALLLPGYVPDPTPYPKVVMHPTTTRDLVTGEAFMPIPVAAPEAEAIIEAPAAKKPKRPGAGKGSNTRPAAAEKKQGKPARPSLSELLNDDGDDIFGTMDKSGK